MDEVKVPEAPVETDKATADESLIDNPRAAVENALIAEAQVAPAVETPEEKVEPTVEEPKAEDPIQKIKDSVQKRIDKVVAQKKSVEEELAEAKAEL